MKQSSLWAELKAEFLGTLILIMIGDGVVAMVNLFGTGVPGEIVKGGYTNITLAWGLAVTFGIYVAGEISGAHLNPAVTLALAMFRDFPWKKVIPYSLAQLAGAFTAAAVVFWNYRPAFAAHDPHLEKTAGVFTTFPAFPAYPMAGLVDQIIGTALLVMLIFAVVDDRARIPVGNLAPLMVGGVVVAIGMGWGGMHGYAINPARDFGPRLFTAIAGFQHNGLTDGTHEWIVPVVGPLIGGVLGAWIFEQGIGKHLSPKATAEKTLSGVHREG